MFKKIFAIYDNEYDLQLQYFEVGYILLLYEDDFISCG